MPRMIATPDRWPTKAPIPVALAPVRKPGRPPASPPVPMKLVRALITAGDRRAKALISVEAAKANLRDAGGSRHNLRFTVAADKAREAVIDARDRWELACAAVLGDV